MDESTSGHTQSASEESTSTVADDEVAVLDGETIGEAFAATGGEEAALKRVRLVARLMDEAVEIPGTDFRVGLDPVLGIVPGAGDAVSALISLYPVVEAYRLGASKTTLLKMLSIVGIDFATGSVPVLGTLVDAVWKANEWNVNIIERLVDGQ
jgi:hypothetical protein